MSLGMESGKRPTTLFSGQWADMPFETLCAKAKKFGFDGIEIPCWGDHFNPQEAIKDRGYCKKKWDVLRGHGLKCYAISNHLVGQAVCDLIDPRHKKVLPDHVWGDGVPENVQLRAAREMVATITAARLFFDASPDPMPKKWTPVVAGFTGSSIWHSVYAFPPTDQNFIQAGFDDFARRFGPILDECDKQNINFGLEVHPTEIAFDTTTAHRAVKAVKGHKRFGFNYDPSHLIYQHVDYIQFIREFGSPDPEKNRIFHVHAKDCWIKRGDGRTGIFGGHTNFNDLSRYWDFRSPGRGDVDFEEIIVNLNAINYDGPLSIEWEDGWMDREEGAKEACDFIRKVDFKPSKLAFDAQFAKEQQA